MPSASAINKEIISALGEIYVACDSTNSILQFFKYIKVNECGFCEIAVYDGILKCADIDLLLKNVLQSIDGLNVVECRYLEERWEYGVEMNDAILKYHGMEPTKDVTKSRTTVISRGQVNSRISQEHAILSQSHGPIEVPIEGGHLFNEFSLHETIERAKGEGLKLTDAQWRGLVFASQNENLSPSLKGEWHALRMLYDLSEIGSSHSELKKSIERVGPVHNALDADGIPVAGCLRERSSTDTEGWLDLDILEFSSGDFSIVGTPSGSLLPLLTRVDLDVAAQLAFLESSEPIEPTFSLEGTGSNRNNIRFDRKQFKPAWLAATPFGQSMYFADWLMKSFTMRDGLPSLTDPLVSGAKVKNWQPPAIMTTVGDATGSSLLPDQTYASSNRLEIVVRSVDVGRAKFSRKFFKSITQYQLHSVDLHIESSLKDSLGNNVRRDDPTTCAGARALIIKDNYDHICSAFPVFERVALLLSVFSMMCQARRDGVELSSSTRQRISKRIGEYKADYSRNYPEYEFSPKPFHKGGCYCNGGISGRTKATVTATQSKPFLERSEPQRLLSNGGASGSGRDANPYKNLDVFAGAAQEKYLFDDVPLRLMRDDGTPSHAISKRGPWRSEDTGALEPFEAAAVRDLFIYQYGSEARQLRELPARPSGKSREISKDIRFGRNSYHVRVKYYADKDGYYEATIYRKDRNT